MLKKNRPARSLSQSDLSQNSGSKSSVSVSSGLFGRELTDVIQANGIPAIVEDCILWIEAEALDEEGLFRIPADAKQLKKLRDMYDAAPKNNYDLNKEKPISAHTVAALLKMYLRELPEPLLLHRFYETFIKVVKNEDTEARIKNLRLLIQGLPVVNRTVLIYLLKFLNKFSSHSNNNKMTLVNLATCWAPNLLRSKEESYEKVMREATLVNSVVTILIENINYIAIEKKNFLERANGSDGQIPTSESPLPSTKPSFSDGQIPAVMLLQTRTERSHSSNSAVISTSSLEAVTPRKESASDWQEAVTKEGRKYYYNVITRVTTWNPPDFFASETAQPVQRQGSDESSSAASKIKLSEKIEGIPAEQSTEASEAPPSYQETPKIVEVPKVEVKKVEVKPTQATSGYINPAKTNTLTVTQLKAMLDECGVDHAGCASRGDLVKKVMESFTVNLPPPLPRKS